MIDTSIYLLHVLPFMMYTARDYSNDVHVYHVDKYMYAYRITYNVYLS